MNYKGDRPRRYSNADHDRHDIVVPNHFCEVCQDTLPHDVNAYPDIEFRRCHKCHTETTWIPIGKKQMARIEQKVEDRSKPDSDFKRTNPRKYKKQKGADEE